MLDVAKILYYYWYYRHRLKFRSRNDFECWQKARLDSFLKTIVAKSHFYKQYAQFQLSAFPVINKSIMMDNFDVLNTANISKSEAFELAFRAEETRDFTPMLNNNIVGLSSGTTGNRGLFLIGPDDRLKWVGMTLAKILPESIFSKYKIAFFMRANSNLYTSVASSSRIQFEFFDLYRDISEHVNRLNEYKPDILVAPARALRFLAEEQAVHRLSINPTKIISVADVLDSADEKFIKSIFRQRVHQVYQCTEGFLAVTCRKGKLHFNEDVVHLEKEWVDEGQRRFIPIITDYNRTAQPIVRYRLDDILVASDAGCDCGSMNICIDKIEGRSDDVLYCRDNQKEALKPVFADFVRRAIMMASEEIKEYKVLQLSPDMLQIAYHPHQREDIEDKIKHSLLELAKDKNFILPNIEFKVFQQKPLYEKARRVERAFKV